MYYPQYDSPHYDSPHYAHYDSPHYAYAMMPATATCYHLLVTASWYQFYPNCQQPHPIIIDYTPFITITPCPQLYVCCQSDASMQIVLVTYTLTTP